MKKLLVLVALLLTGCSIQTTTNNEQQEYIKVHLFETNKCYEALDYSRYNHDSVRTVIELKDYGTIELLHYPCIIVHDKCPICD